MAGGGQGSGGFGGGQGAGGMGGGAQPGAGGDLGPAMYTGGSRTFDESNLTGTYLGQPGGGGYGGGMGGFGGGYGMGSPFGGFGMGMPTYGGFGMGMGSPFGGYGSGMGGFGGYGMGMGMPYGGYGLGMPFGGYGGGMGGFDGGMKSGFSRGMGSPFRGGMGGIQDRMYRGEPGMAYAGGSPDFDFRGGMGGIQDGGINPGGGMTQIQGGSSRGNLEQFNQALRGGFKGPMRLPAQFAQPAIQPAVEPIRAFGQQQPAPEVMTGGPAEVVQPAPEVMTGGPAEVVQPPVATTKPYIEPAATPAAPQVPTVPEAPAMSSSAVTDKDGFGPAAPRLPFIPNTGVMGKPGEYAAPFAGGDPNYKPLERNFTSAQDAYDRTLAHARSPQYRDYYMSFAPSTRAYIPSPDNPERMAQAARDYYMQYGNADSFARRRTGGIASLLKRK